MADDFPCWGTRLLQQTQCDPGLQGQMAQHCQHSLKTDNLACCTQLHNYMSRDWGVRTCSSMWSACLLLLLFLLLLLQGLGYTPRQHGATTRLSGLNRLSTYTDLGQDCKVPVPGYSFKSGVRFCFWWFLKKIISFAEIVVKMANFIAMRNVLSVL